MSKLSAFMFDNPLSLKVSILAECCKSPFANSNENFSIDKFG